MTWSCLKKFSTKSKLTAETTQLRGKGSSLFGLLYYYYLTKILIEILRDFLTANIEILSLYGEMYLNRDLDRVSNFGIEGGPPTAFGTSQKFPSLTYANFSKQKTTNGNFLEPFMRNDGY